MKSSVRPATHNDIPFIIENLILAWQETDHPSLSLRKYQPEFVEKRVREMIDEGCSFVCAGGHLMAFIDYDMFDPTLVYSVSSMFVRKEFRSKGTAVRMLKAAQFQAELENCGVFEVGESSGINSEKVRDLYERMGFTCQRTTYMKDI